MNKFLPTVIAVITLVSFWTGHYLGQHVGKQDETIQCTSKALEGCEVSAKQANRDADLSSRERNFYLNNLVLCISELKAHNWPIPEAWEYIGEEK